MSTKEKSADGVSAIIPPHYAKVFTYNFPLLDSQYDLLLRHHLTDRGDYGFGYPKALSNLSPVISDVRMYAGVDHRAGFQVSFVTGEGVGPKLVRTVVAQVRTRIQRFVRAAISAEKARSK